MQDAGSIILMSEQEGWGVVPDAVVGRILWSDDLRLLKLRCREVCRTRTSRLRKGPSGPEPTNRSSELCIALDFSDTGQQRLASRLDEDPSALDVLIRSNHVTRLLGPPSRNFQSPCCRPLGSQGLGWADTL